jgi:hypothetical protein
MIKDFLDTTPMSLWPVNVLTTTVDADPAWNIELAEIARDYSKNWMNRDHGPFKHSIPHSILMHYKSPAIWDLFQTVRMMVYNYISTFYGLTPQDIDEPRFNMWGNTEGYREWSVPHAHHGNQMVVTYYPEVFRHPDDDPKSGNFVFHNPKAIQSTFMARRETQFTPIVTKTGTLIAFPGNAPHSTFPMFHPESKKVALITNVRFTSAGEGSEGLTYRPLRDVEQFQGFKA